MKEVVVRNRFSLPLKKHFDFKWATKKNGSVKHADAWCLNLLAASTGKRNTLCLCRHAIWLWSHAHTHTKNSLSFRVNNCKNGIMQINLSLKELNKWQKTTGSFKVESLGGSRAERQTAASQKPQIDSSQSGQPASSSSQHSLCLRRRPEHSSAPQGAGWDEHITETY